jgi:hypothetical protein
MTSTDNHENASLSSEDSLNRKIKATSLGKGLQLFNGGSDESEEEEAEPSRSANSSHLNSLITQRSNMNTPKAAPEVASIPRRTSPRRDIPAVAIVPRTSPRLAARSKSSSKHTTKKNSSSNNKKKQNRTGEGLLPDGLETLTRSSRDNFHIDFDEHQNPLYATKVIGTDGKEYDLMSTDLKLSQLRKLASNVGVKNHHRSKKEAICEMIAESIMDEVLMANAGTHPEKNVARKTNSLCRLVNCFFSEKLFHRLERVNDLLKRVDHETGQTYKNFWSDVKLDYEKRQDNDEITRLYGADDANGDPILQQLSKETYIDLKDFINLTEDGIRKSLSHLFKVRKGIKERMTVSGTHSNSAWDFVQASLKDLKDGGGGTTMVTKDSAYYFFCRCNEYPDIDAKFQTFLDDAIKGSTEDLDSDDSSSMSTSFNITQQAQSSGGSSKGRNKRSSLSPIQDILREYKRKNRQEDRESSVLVDTSVIMALMENTKTQLQVHMYMKDDQKIAECTQQLMEYQEQLKELRSKPAAEDGND